ncbi:MAG: hypothetical protein GXX82_11785 [Syntrophorhabdus sp.]|nr:hypothetical protein [Syntrophorhabdus sp.]
MSKTKDLQYFMGLNYDAVMRRKGEEFCLFIPELSITAYGKDIGDAYANLTAEKERYFKNIVEFDLQETVSEPASVTIRKKQYHELVQFILKILVVFVLIVILFTALFLPVLASFEKAVSRTAASIPEKVIPRVVEKVEGQLTRMSDEDREKTRLRIRAVVTSLKPFADEFKALFADGPKPAVKSGTAKKGERDPSGGQNP